MLNRKISWFVLLLLGGLFIALNWQIPRVIDDYPYSRSFVGVQSMVDDQNMDATIDGIGDLLDSQMTHYQAINGRVLVHAIVQMFCCWFGQVPFDILQGVFFVLFLLLLGKHAGSKNTLAGSLVVLLYMVLFREPACIYHGVACGINYLWVITLMLAFRLLYLKENTHPLLLGGMAFAAGLSNEAVAIPFAGAFFFELLLQWRKSTPQQRIVVFLMCLGTLVLVVAPANFQRLSSVRMESESTSSLPFHLQPLPNLRMTALCLVMGVATWFFKWRGFVRENAFWVIAIVLSVLMSLAIGGENIRQCIAAELCSAILIVKMGRRWIASKYQKFVLLGSSCVLCLAFMGINYIQYPMSERFEEARLYVENSKDKNVVIPTIDISYPPQLEKYRCCELSDFQLEQFRWWYRKESVSLELE